MKKKLFREGGDGGFTLIELMVVMAIIAVLAVLIIGAVQLARKTATETQHRSNSKTIQTALESNYAKYKAYCGNANNPITSCGATGTGSLKSFATDLVVTLSASSSEGICAANGDAEGGGRVTAIEANSYTIDTAVFNCLATDPYNPGDQIKVP